ncbi:MAG: ATP synthase F1 subunit epsilon [Bacteroidaceae bacterium]|nr:ATP synthase F1 subunit epsilon [Bacteroidaceae bacterium]
MSLKLKIVSPEKVVYEGEVDSVLVPGTKGQFEILMGHAPIISTLEKGSVRFTPKDGECQYVQVLNGFVEVHSNNVSICAEL